MLATFLYPFETRKECHLVQKERLTINATTTANFYVSCKCFCASRFFLAFTLDICKNCHIIAVVRNMLLCFSSKMVTGHLLQMQSYYCMQFVSLFNLNSLRNSIKNRKVDSISLEFFFFGANFRQSFPKNRNNLLTSSRKTVIKFFRCQKRFIIIIKNFLWMCLFWSRIRQMSFLYC